MNRRRLIYFLPVVILAGFAFLGMDLVNNWIAERSAKPCTSHTNVYMPVIAEFGSDYLILQGNGTKLRRGDRYRFSELAGPDIEIHVLEINDEGASFVVQIQMKYAGEPGSIPPHTTVFRCKLFVDKNDDMFRPRFEGVLVQPDDFGSDWRIRQYTEYVLQSSILPAEDQSHATISLAHDKKTYLVSIRLYRFASEETAIGMADEDILSDIAYATDSTHFQSQASRFIEGCDRTGRVCVYEGQYQQFRLHIAMHVHLGRIVVEPGPNIPMQDWHYVIGLVETTLIGGAAPGP